MCWIIFENLAFFFYNLFQLLCPAFYIQPKQNLPDSQILNLIVAPQPKTLPRTGLGCKQPSPNKYYILYLSPPMLPERF